MAYKTKDLFEIGVKAIEEHKLFFIEDIKAYLPCHRTTFYDHFPAGSDYHKEFITMLEKNRTEVKVSMRSKWYKSDAPSLQIALMKIIATDEELKKLSMQHNQNENTEVPYPMFGSNPLDKI